MQPDCWNIKSEISQTRLEKPRSQSFSAGQIIGWPTSRAWQSWQIIMMIIYCPMIEALRIVFLLLYIETTSLGVCASVYINYTVLCGAITHKFFNYRGTLLVLSVSSCLVELHHVLLWKRSQWVLADGRARSRHTAQPFWNTHASVDSTWLHAVA